MTLHYKAEGRYSYAVLLFAPSTRPFDLFDPAPQGPRQALRAARLHHRRRGPAAVLSAVHPRRGRLEDLPLNISREMLQNNPQVGAIRKALTGRVISELETLAEKDAEAFGKIWEAFGPVLKEGIYEDFEKREQLLKLARFDTTAGKARSLKQYVADLKAEPDRDLLPRRRQRRAAEVQPEARSRARARHRGAAAERSGRCVLDHDAAGLRGQAAQVAEQGRRRFQPRAAARRQERRAEDRRCRQAGRGDHYRRREARARRARRRT